LAQIPSSNWPLSRFVSRLASAEPIPGGGSAAALAGSLGCGLGRMVCRILLSRSRTLASAKVQIRRHLTELERCSRELEQLIAEDARVYQQLVRAFKSQRGIAGARRRATETPIRICEAAARGAEVMKDLSPLAGSVLSSDLKAGRALLKGAFGAAFVTAQINLQGKELPANTALFRRRLTQLRKRIG